mmetsp:Transcript_26814/g.61829  ORF Transcript_26814/g.61829 Transcript_26814/m.61829 type:complete len:145 (-) Transcript_26814:87-521(-)
MGAQSAKKDVDRVEQVEPVSLHGALEQLQQQLGACRGQLADGHLAESPAAWTEEAAPCLDEREKHMFTSSSEVVLEDMVDFFEYQADKLPEQLHELSVPPTSVRAEDDAGDHSFLNCFVRKSSDRSLPSSLNGSLSLMQPRAWT